MSSGAFKLGISTLPLGYAMGMDQPSVTVTIALDSPTLFLEHAAWKTLTEVFLISPDEVPPPRVPGALQLTPEMRQVFQAAACLARHLLCECGVPAFCPEVVEGVTPLPDRPSGCEIRFRAPAMDHLPRDRIAAAYFHALNFIWNFTSPTPDPQSIKALADSFLAQFIAPLRSVLGRGLSTQPILREAYARGIPTAHLGNGVFQLGTGAFSRLIKKSATDRDPVIASELAHQKDIAQTVFREIGIPVAEALLVPDADAAVAAARSLGFPVVVKPANLERSEGVFLDLETEAAVREAFEKARALSARILVQRRIPGHCTRLVAFQGKFVFGYTRHPAGVDGDGSRTVRELVQAFNDAHERKAKHLQAKPIPFDEAAIACLADQGIGPEDVLEKGRVAFMRKANLMAYAGYNEIVTDRVHPENIAIIERLARVFRLESIGVDLISPDPTRPWHETGAAVTEVNFQPQIGENTARANLAAMYPAGSPTAIPIECFVGGKAAMRAGRRRLEALGRQGDRAVLTSHEITLDHRGAPYHLAGLDGLYARCVALLRDPAVTTLVVVVQTDALVRTGPPFRGNVTIHRIDTGVCSDARPNRPVPPGTVDRLIRCLEGQ